jgi:signal transduction histidine kinase
MDEKDVMMFLRGVNSGANRLRRLVENFITLVELDSGDAKRTYEWRRRPIVSLYDHVMDAYQQITYPDEQPREFECHVADGIPEFVADAQMMTMAIRELLDNAAKFTPADSRFILRAQCVGEWVEIQVEDFGRGLPASEYENVWQPFYQFERDKFEHQGAGSGLAIVDGVLSIHGGERSVSSVEGKGSTFTIRLPMQPPAVPPRIGE